MKKLLSALLCLGLCFGIAGCSNDDISDNSGDSKQEEKKEDKVYKVGDVATYSEYDKDLYTFKINSVKTTKERNEFADSQPEQVIIVNYTYENIGSDEDVYVDGVLNFTVIDEDGNVCDTYPVAMDKQAKETPKGAKCTAETAYGLIKKSSKIKLRFKEPFGNAEANFEIDL